MALQHLRTSTAHKRPIPSVMSAGQIAVNTNEASPGLFFKDSNGDLVKVGPVHIGTDAPNSSPASVAATALVTGTVYQILTVGTSDFTLVGASANTVGTVFTATGTTTGTGTVSGQQGVEKGEQWLDTTGGTYLLKIYDGTAWRSESGTFVDVSGDTMTGALLLDNASSAAAPDLSFDGDTDTGIYSGGSNKLSFSAKSRKSLEIIQTGSTSNSNETNTIQVSNPGYRAKFEVLDEQGTAIVTLRTDSDSDHGIFLNNGANNAQTAQISSKTTGAVKIQSGDANNGQLRLGVVTPEDKSSLIFEGISSTQSGWAAGRIDAYSSGSGSQLQSTLRFSLNTSENNDTTTAKHVYYSNEGLSNEEVFGLGDDVNFVVGQSWQDNNWPDYDTTAPIVLRPDGSAFFTGPIAIGDVSVLRRGQHPDTNPPFPNAELHVENTPNCNFQITSGPSGSSQIKLGDTDDANIGKIKYDNSNNSLSFDTNNSTRLTIDSNGNLDLAGGRIANGTPALGSSGFDLENGGVHKLARDTATGNSVLKVMGNSGTNGGEFRVKGDGDCENTNGNYDPISSDERLKENIVDASSQWEDIKGIRFRSFNYISKPDTRMLGCVAQELQQVCPSLIKTRPASEEEIADNSNTISQGDQVLTFKQIPLLLKAAKALQEAMERIETLETKVAALEAGS